MSSSLVTQLQDIASGSALKGNLFHLQKTRASYLFDPKQAAEYDLNAIHSIGVSGLEELKIIDKVFVDFENTIFSESMKTVDRTLQTKEDNERLDKSIGHFLSLLSPYFLIKPAGKALEWLIRRFRINEFNVNDILACILPYHETYSFVTMVSILHLNTNDQWSFLQQIQQKRQPLDRASLIKMCIKDTAMLQFICEIAVNSKHTFKTLISFYVAVIIHYIQNIPKLTDNNLAVLLPYIMDSCKKNKSTDLRIGTFMIICQITNKAELSSDTVSGLILRILKSNPQIELHSLLCIVHICQTQESVTKFSSRITKRFQKFPDLEAHLAKISEKYQMDRFLKIFFTSFISRLLKKDFDADFLIKTLQKVPISPYIVGIICSSIMDFYIAEKKARHNLDVVMLQNLLRLLQAKYSTELGIALESKLKTINQNNVGASKEINDALYKFVADTYKKTVHEPISEVGTTLLLSVNHAEPNIRLVAFRKMVEMIQNEDSEFVNNSTEFIRSTLLARLHDDNEDVFNLLLTVPQILIKYIPITKLLQSLMEIIESPMYTSETKSKIYNFLIEHYWTLSNHPKDDDFSDTNILLILLKNLLVTKQNKEQSAKFLKKLGTLQDVDLVNGVEKVAELLEHDRKGKSSSIKHDSRLVGVNISIIKILSDNLASCRNIESGIEVYMQALQSDSITLCFLTILVLNRAASLLEGDRKLRIVTKLLAHILKNLSSPKNENENTPDCNFIVQDGLPPETLVSEIISNISSSATETMLRVFTLMNLVSSLKPITGHKMSWLKKQEEENRTILVDLFKAIITGPDINCTDIIIKQFFVTHFSDDVIQFCCNILITDESSDILKIRSLQIANAYICTYTRPETSSQIDFQLIIPSLMTALTDPNPATRKSALSCLESIYAVYSKDKPKNTEINGTSKASKKNVHTFGTTDFYGDDNKSGEIEDLTISRKVISNFVKDLIGHRDEVLGDHTYIRRFVAKELNEEKNDNKRLLSFFLSHVKAFSETVARIKILEILSLVDSQAKLKTLYPLMEDTLALIVNNIQDTGNMFSIKLMELLIRCFTEKSVSLLDKDDKYSTFFVSLLKSKAPSGNEKDTDGLIKPIVYAALSQISGKLFAFLTNEKQQDVFSSILDFATSSDSYDFTKECKDALKRISIPAKLVQKELSDINKNLEDIQTAHQNEANNSKKHAQDQFEEPNTKRARHEYQQDESPDRVLTESTQEKANTKELAPQTSKHILPLHRLSTILELLQCKPKPDIDEVSSLASFFALLTTLFKYKLSDDSISVDFIVQLILGRLTEIVKISTRKTNAQLYYQLDLSIVGDYLLESRNSQIQNQCLLFISAVAVLEPIYVLNKIMPLFTAFLEETGLQQDNEYSNSIIRHTMELVLPVVIKQKEKQSNREAASSNPALRAKEILGIFVYAIDRMPRTRRVPILTTLIQALGENDFLYAITGMLLSSACTPQPGKFQVLEASYISELCLTLMEQFSLESQIRSVIRLFEELLILPNNIKHRYKKLSPTHGIPIDDYLFQIYGQTTANILHLKNISVKFVNSLFTQDEFLMGLLEWENEDMNYQTQIQDLFLKLSEVMLKLSLDLESYQSSSSALADMIKEISTSISGVLFTIHGLVPNPSFVSITRALLNHTDLKIRSKAITLLHEHLINYESNNNLNNEPSTQIIEILSDLNSLIATNNEGTNVENLICKQNAMNCLSSFIHRFVSGNEELFTQCVTPVISEAVLQHQNVNLRISSIACLAHICHEIGLRIVPFLPQLMPQLLNLLQSSLNDPGSENHQLNMAILATFEAIVTNVPSFVAPYLPQLLEYLLHPAMYQDQYDKEHIIEIYENIFTSISTNIEPRILLPQYFDIYQKVVEFGTGSIILLLKVLEKMVISVKGEVLLDYRTDVFKFLLLPFDYRRMHKNHELEEILKVEDQAISVFYNFLLKLNEDLFKPLFLWMVDWATTDPSLGTDIDYRLTFLFRLINHLLKEMQHIFSPYYRSVVDICIAKLQDYKEGRRQFDDLWNYIVDSLQKYFMHEKNVFETTEKYKNIMHPLVDQLLGSVDHEHQHQEQYEDRITQHLMPCLVQLANNLDDPEKLDLLHKQVLLHMHPRTSSVQVRLGALRVMRELYEKLGEAFSDFFPEAVPHLVELTEDDDQRVEMSNAELIRIIEKLVGQSFDDFLQ
ncbi:12813_t:CDS:10 [Ambispora gerdemannii]|uniref:U3 small nucleolar RNA-associated protein 10 n=1 Tax=Ambispora gerdemannii TaxID=144530 RepID=A0A9N8W033_9GLOM|nr:12813_t:CDS:10 [Ambispora gerdemannii]